MQTDMIADSLLMTTGLVITLCQLLTLWMLYDCHRLAHNVTESNGSKWTSMTENMGEALSIGADIADRLDEVLIGGAGSASPSLPNQSTGGSIGEVVTTLLLNQLMPQPEPHGSEQSRSVHSDQEESTQTQESDKGE